MKFKLIKSETVEYKEIPGFPGYLISKYGLIKSIKSKKYLKSNIGKQGYRHLVLMKNGKKVCMKIHRLVALTWLEKPLKEIYEINHKNANKLDNRASNLEWVSKSENLIHAYKMGLLKMPDFIFNQNGENNRNAILTEDLVREIRSNHRDGAKRKDLAKIYNINLNTLGDVIYNKGWKHLKD